MFISTLRRRIYFVLMLVAFLPCTSLRAAHAKTPLPRYNTPFDSEITEEKSDGNLPLTRLLELARQKSRKPSSQTIRLHWDRDISGESVSSYCDAIYQVKAHILTLTWLESGLLNPPPTPLVGKNGDRFAVPLTIDAPSMIGSIIYEGVTLSVLQRLAVDHSRDRPSGRSAFPFLPTYGCRPRANSAISLTHLVLTGDALLYPLDTLVQALRQNPKAAHFHVEWLESLGPRSGTFSVDFNRPARSLYLRGAEGYSQTGAEHDFAIRFGRVTDSALEKCAESARTSVSGSISTGASGFDGLSECGCPRTQFTQHGDRRV